VHVVDNIASVHGKRINVWGGWVNSSEEEEQ
jgi:hypothetical protein